MTAFIHSFQSEWLKRKRSLATWLVIVGGFFTPSIIIVIRLIHHDQLLKIYSAPDFWNRLWHTSWESVAMFLLPLGVVMATSLIAQLEYKNNTWKQLHTTPVSLTTIYFSKLSVIMIMMLQFFILFNIGIYLSGMIPFWIVTNVPYPNEPASLAFFLEENAYYMIDCLPIIALQYLISLKYKNFLVPLGVGIGVWILAIGAIRWKYGYLMPYSYTMYYHLKDGGKVHPAVNIHMMAIGYFVVITVVGYVMYVLKREKG